MKNKNGTIILSIILVVQFIIPLSVWGYETYKNKELKEKGQEVKLLVDYVFCDNRGVTFRVEDVDDFMFENDSKYIVFKNGEDGFFETEEVSDITDGDLYVSANKLRRIYDYGYDLRYESEITRAYEDYGYFDLYNKETEAENIAKGYCNGPQTKAYAVFKVYKNRIKVVNVYIDEKPVDTVIEKYMNNEMDLSRYEYQYDKEYGSYLDEELVEEIYDAVMDGYVTEPVVA